MVIYVKSVVPGLKESIIAIDDCDSSQGNKHCRTSKWEQHKELIHKSEHFKSLHFPVTF